MPIAAEIVAHHLRIAGLVGARLGEPSAGAAVLILDESQPGRVEALTPWLEAGGVAVLLQPEQAALVSLGLEVSAKLMPPAILSADRGAAQAWGRLRSLHPVIAYAGSATQRVVATAEGAASWVWLRRKAGGLLV